MPPKDTSHRRTHNLLLISRLLSQRDNVSPFTLLLDSLHQSARPLLNEYITRATASKCRILHLTFESFTPPPPLPNLTALSASGKPLPQLQREIQAHIHPDTRTLIIIDSLHPLISTAPLSLSPFLSSLLVSPQISLLAVYHLDVPPVLPPAGSADAYPETAPSPLTLLEYFATSIIRTHSIAHVLARKKARDRSEAPPVFGLDEGVEGVLVGRGSGCAVGMVLEMEYRRKSGRGVKEWFYLPLEERQPEGVKVSELPGGVREKVILLEEHPEWRVSEQVEGMEREEEEKGPESSFSLGLTEGQRKRREEVVLPYFDAQREGGIGGGGAILFTPDKDIDDWDDEEDAD